MNRAWDSVEARLAIGLVALAGIAMAFFDLGAPVALNDDWMFTWTARRLVEGHGLQKVPGLIPYGLVHVLWGVTATVGHLDPRLLRLTEIPFVALTGWAVWRLSRDLGADKRWAVIGSATVLCSPLVLNLANGFQSDIPYLGLVLAATVAGTRWVRSGEMRMACVVLTLLAFLERQTAVLLLPALVAWLIRTRGVRGLRRSDWKYLALATLGLGGVTAAAQAIGFSGAAAARLLDVAHGPARNLIAGTIFLPEMLGFGLLPLAAAMAWASLGSGWRTREQTLHSRPRRWRNAVAFGAVTAAVAIFVGFTAAGHSDFPGDHISALGVGPPLLAGDKPQLFPTPLFLGLELAVLLAFAALVNWWRVTDHRALAMPMPRAFVATVAALQLLTVAQGSFDRYIVPVTALLVPLVVSALPAVALPRRVALWAPAVMAAGLVAFAAGEQDYLAWQWARDVAAKQTYTLAPPSQVNAGYEANGVYWELPTYERLGVVDGALTLGHVTLPSLDGPPNPRYRLFFAPVDDPRPGVAYRSLAPGKIVRGR